MDVFDAAQRYRADGRPLIVLAGRDYGSGSSRDWAAKGPWMLVGVASQSGKNKRVWRCGKIFNREYLEIRQKFLRDHLAPQKFAALNTSIVS